ncbi:MAG TPA: MarR family transcriptional regulator [Deltaproteobacteria bacterium]|nr:MarR family transcriptional regulator [Deltaproteobacteria bacterium]HPR52602.1 MarR family transcriptional regulator [Deltaproteobacteria bacterium]
MTKKEPRTPPEQPERPDAVTPPPQEHNLSTTEISQALLGLTVSDDAESSKATTKETAGIENYDMRILMALRRIMHFIDTYSRRLAVKHHITGPQLICLYSIVNEGPLTLSALGKRVSLSMSTVNGIVDRLENKNLILRERKDKDRRKVLITATQAGIALASSAPLPLQDRLSLAIADLPDLEQVSIALSLERIVEMMEDKT